MGRLSPFFLRPSRGAPGASLPHALSSRRWLRGLLTSLSLPLPAPQETHRLYRLKLEELIKLQNSCTSSITRQKKRLQELALVLKKLGPSPAASTVPRASRTALA